MGNEALNILWSPFHELPHPVNPCKLLAYKLALPGCLYPFEECYLPNSESVDLRTLVPDQELTAASRFLKKSPAPDEEPTDASHVLEKSQEDRLPPDGAPAPDVELSSTQALVKSKKADGAAAAGAATTQALVTCAA